MLLAGVEDVTIAQKHYFLEPLRNAVGIWGIRVLLFAVVALLVVLYFRLKQKGNEEEDGRS